MSFDLPDTSTRRLWVCFFSLAMAFGACSDSEDPQGSAGADASSDEDVSPARDLSDGSTQNSDQGPLPDTEEADGVVVDVASDTDVADDLLGDLPVDELETDSSEECETCGPMASAWPMFGHDERNTGRSEAVFASDYELLFAIEAVSGWGYSGTAISDEDVIVGAADVLLPPEVFLDEEMIYGYPTTYEDGDDPLFSLSINGFFDPTEVFGIGTTPVLGADGSAHFFCQSGYLISADLAEDLKAVHISVAPANEWAGSLAYRSNPVMDEDGDLYGVSSSIFAGTQPHIVKLTRDGEVVWTLNLGQDLSGATGDCTPAITDEGLVIAVNERVVVAVDRNSGDVIHHHPSYWEAPPAIDDPWWGNRPPWLVQWDDETGGRNLLASPSIDQDGTIYVASNQGLRAFNSDLTEKWTDPLDFQLESGMAAIGPDLVYVTSSSQLVALEKQAGNIVWTFPDEDDEADVPEGDRLGTVTSYVPPVVDDCGNVAVLAQTDTGVRLLVFRTNDGEEELVFASPPGEIDLNDPTPMSVDAQGRIFIRGDRLYGYGGSTPISCGD